MPRVVCPHCGCRQPAGDVCRICQGTLSKEAHNELERMRTSLAAAGIPQVVVAPRKLRPGILRRAWRISNWLTLAALVVVVALILLPAPAPEIQVDLQASQRATAKLREAQAALSSGHPTELRLDEAELNAFLASMLGMQGAPNTEAAGGDSSVSLDQARSNVKDLKVTMQDDRLHAYLLFDFHGKDLTLLLEGGLSAKDGYLRFEPTGGRLGSLPIPQSALEAAVERMLESPENRDKLRLPDGVGDVHIENGQLVVTLRQN